MANKDIVTAIDLFSGCGGLSKGFMDAGFTMLAGVDNNKIALKTYERNIKGAKGISCDLSTKEGVDKIVKVVGNRKLDMIIAGPPCQGFSVTGPRNFDDPRNKLYLAVFDMVDVLKPKAFLIENVWGMASLYGGQIKDEIIRRFTVLGYNISWRVVCAADYGVPQIRKRLIFVGLKKEIGKFEFPAPYLAPENYITCKDAISDLPPLINDLGFEVSEYTMAPQTDYQKLMRQNATHLYNHVATRHTELVISTIAQVPDGGNYKDLPAGVGESRKFHVAWTRYASNKPSSTIDTGHRNHFHYSLNRIPTARENARLQSFPDDFVFEGTKTAQYKQIGNAVPPLLGKALALKILEYIKNVKD